MAEEEKLLLKREKKEKNRLMKIFCNLDPNLLQTALPLIDRAAFITVNLQVLEQQLRQTGWVESYQNGENQSGIKKSAAADVHISLTKNLNAIMKQLLEIVPPSQRKSKLEELLGE